MSNVGISFTGTVERHFVNDDNTTLIVKIDDGSKYGGKANVYCGGRSHGEAKGAHDGSTVKITCDRMPYGKVREYEKDGETKRIANVHYSAQSVTIQGGGAPAPAPIADTFVDDSIPF